VLYFSLEWLCGVLASGMPISSALPDMGKAKFSWETIPPQAADCHPIDWKTADGLLPHPPFGGSVCL